MIKLIYGGSMRDSIGAIKIDELISSGNISILNADEDYTHYKIKYNNDIYYMKLITNSDKLYNELIAEEIAHDFNIKCAQSDLGIYNGNYYCLSKQIYNSNDKYIPMQKLMDEYDNNLNYIWNLLEDKYRDRKLIAKLMNDIVNIFLFDVLIANYDRHVGNYGLIISNNNVSVAPIFDNENMLSVYSMVDGDFCIGMEDKDYYESDLFTKFLKLSSDIYLEKFESKLWIIEQENIKKVIEKVENKIGIQIDEETRKRILLNFSDNLCSIKSIISDYRKVR